MKSATPVDPSYGTTPAASAKCAPGLTVLYDGSCPLCRREISVYQGSAATQPLSFRDVSDPALEPPAGVPVEALMARFHVQHADGRLESGASAFIALWAVMPGWRWLARLGRLPGMTQLMEWAYLAFLRLRPALQLVARHLERRASQPSQATPSPLPREVMRELRTDHAGETGAVMIYRGILAVTRDPALRAFAQHHLDTERRHLHLIEQIVPSRDRSRLLPLWRLSGWLTGALPSCTGPRAVYATIQAVETFVDRHYADQIKLIDALLGQPIAGTSTTPSARELQELRAILEQCRLDEVSHRDDAAQRWEGRASGLLRVWQGAVGRGSASAVALCRLI